MRKQSIAVAARSKGKQETAAAARLKDKQDVVAVSQILFKNPILGEDDRMRQVYFSYLKHFVNIGGWENRKSVQSQLNMYARRLSGGAQARVKRDADLLGKYKFLLFFDLIAILEYEGRWIFSDAMERVKKRMANELGRNEREWKFFLNAAQAVKSNSRTAWKKVESFAAMKKFQEFLFVFEENLCFVREPPYHIFVTATMSAGKSTFINALTGKNICLSQNMACTSKIHSIAGKAFEDGMVSKYDYELLMDVGEEEVLHDDDRNQSDKIAVGTYYDGLLGGQRLVLHDSPGVNYSENDRHRQITTNMLRSGKYALLIYIMNATQLGTTDDAAYLELVKKSAGDRPVLFILNKVDAFHAEDEEIEEVIKRQAAYLVRCGFAAPAICPVSAKAGFLAKKSRGGKLGRIERRELNCMEDKFEEMNLVDYYGRHFPDVLVEDSAKEDEQVLKLCGLSYVEAVIKQFCEKGGQYGTGTKNR